MFNVAVASYLKEEYEEILALSEDRDMMDDTWDEWRLNSAKRIKQLKQMGLNVERVIIHPDALVEYCKTNRLSIIGKHRAQMASDIMNNQNS